MAQVARGGDITLQVQFYEFSGGDPVEATDVSLEIIDSGAVVAGPFTGGQLTDTGVGSWEFTWTVPTDRDLGTHTAKWTGTVNGNVSEGYEHFDVVTAGSVLTGGTALFVTVDDVRDITGVTVNNEQVLMAQHVIELAINRRSLSSGDMTKRDLHYLKLAVAYEAAYIDGHPEIFVQMDFQQLSQGDIFVGLNKGGQPYLAPLAKLAIQKLTWTRTRSIQVNSHFQRSSVDADNAAYADRDDDDDWSAI